MPHSARPVIIESEVLNGLSVRTRDGLVVFVAPGDGPAGVREPRRPLPSHPPAALALAETP